MTLDLPTLASDFDEMAADLPSTINFSAFEGQGPFTIYDAITDEPKRGEKLEIDGITGEYDLAIVVKLASCAAAPGIGQLLAFGARRYRVKTINDDPAGVCATLACEAV